MLEPSNDIEARLLALFRDDMNIAVPSCDTDLIDQGLLNSVSFVDFILLLETRFGLTIALEDVEIDQLRTISSIAALTHRLMQAAA